MKVGDTIRALIYNEDGDEINPEDIDADIQWFMGKTELTGETDDTLDVTLDMLGEELSVIVTIDGVEYTDSTLAVTVEGELAILAAEQKGAKTIEATFSEAITALDKLTVSKNGEELKQAYAPKIADDGLSATITLENRITAGTYTVTLTPANGTDDPSSVEFEGEVASLSSIEFVSDYLIMKDNEYKEGYAYIKGTDQFGEDMSLSSVTVIPGYGHFRSYDATTGKITIGVDDDETNFAIVKEVPVFVTYQNGADTIPANATLKVTTMSYVQELTFGDIYKADGSKVDDDTNPLMIGDLKSKPYVEILDVEDQYGNPLSAKDLNDQASGSTKVLFVIPDDTTTSAYYSTGKFSTITEKDGTKKTILYLASGGDMPGSMDLIITGASGQSFSKPITVKDDPYIDVLRVNYPTLYEGTDESDALEFTAVDQYGKEIKDLFNFAPKVVGQTLVFGDMNHQTNKVTQITAPDGVNWVVKKDNINKKFTVSIKLNPTVKKGATLVMMATTAGLKVTPTNLTVGQRTNGESIDTAIGGNLNLDPQNTKFEFNKNVRFLSSNGTVMDRVENEQYPVFLKATTDATVETNSNATYTAVMNNVTDEKPAFFWTVSLGKEGKVTHTGNANGIANFVIEPANTTDFDRDGVVKVNELGVANADGATITALGDYVEHKNGTYYVTLYKASKETSGDYNVAVIDKQSFKLTYSPTKVDGVWQLGTQYTASVKENRAVYANDADEVTIQVKAYPNVGEPYFVPADFITVTGATSNVYNNGLKVKAKAAGSATFSVYVQEPGDTQGVYTTVKVTADATQTATKLQKDFAAVAVNAGNVNSKVGANFTDSSRTATEWSADTTAAFGDAPSVVTINNGQMNITHANRLSETLTLGIKDQHGIAMKDAKFYVDGLAYSEFWTNNTYGQSGVPAVGVNRTGKTDGVERHIIEVRSADDSIISHNIIELGDTIWHYKKEAASSSTTVYNLTQFKAAFTADSNDTVTLGADIALDGDFTIAKGDKVIVPAEWKLTLADASTLTVNGTLEVSGVVTDGGEAATITGTGTVDQKTGAEISVDTVNMTDDDSLHVAKGASLTVNTLSGFVYAHEDIVANNIGATAVITINKGLDISADDGSVPTITEGAEIIVKADEDDIEASITLGDNTVEVTPDEDGDFVITDAKKAAEQAKADEFKTTYAAILAKTADATETGIKLTDEKSLGAAETAYAALDGGVKTLLTTEAETLGDLREYVDGLAILADANTIKEALETVTVSGATFTIPATYQTQILEMANGSAASAPETTATGRWSYNEGVFTVTEAQDTTTATAAWTVSKNGQNATVTLTLTGTNNAATYSASVTVSEVSAAG